MLGLEDFARDEHASWLRDPWVWVAAALGTGLTAWALFAGRYLPGIDYSNHLGLISVLAHGAENGSLDYLTRSFAPTPYLLFYALTAAFAQLVTVDVAAKLSLSLAALLLVLCGADYASATGRSPRLAALAPLAMFGVSYGYGFVTFVFTTPLLFFALARAERLIAAGGPELQRAGALYALSLVLCFLGHGLLFWTVALLLIARVALLGLLSLARTRGAAWRDLLRTTLRLAAGALPATLIALPSILTHLGHPDLEAGTAPPSSMFSFEPWSAHAAQLGGHLLERGSPQHWRVMTAALAAFVLLALGGVALRRATVIAEDARRAAWIYAAGLLAIFLVGPMSLEWPSSVWYVYPRYGVLAALAVWMLPRARLSGAFGAAIVLVSLALVGWNAALNAGHVAQFSSWASRYDGVRALVPPRTRVLALTVVPPGDFTQQHPALGSLYFYHLVDGASYTAFLFDKRAHPVHSRDDRKPPMAPFWRAPDSYDPRTHGREFDYLVLRGEGLVRRTEEAGTHERVADVNGWVVFRTKDPVPRP